MQMLAAMAHHWYLSSYLAAVTMIQTVSHAHAASSWQRGPRARPIYECRAAATPSSIPDDNVRCGTAVHHHVDHAYVTVGLAASLHMHTISI